MARYRDGPVLIPLRKALLKPLAVVALLVMATLCGCSEQYHVFKPDRQPLVDRGTVEFPSGLDMTIVADGLTAATSVTVADDGIVYLADNGARGDEVRLNRLDPDTGESHEIYPARRAIVSWFDDRMKLRGPVGGLAFRDGELYVSARNEEDRGVVVAFDLTGWELGGTRPPVRIVVGDLPAAGDHSVTDLSFHPLNDRLFFGVGSATNSGVVGLDNWDIGWPKQHRGFHDIPLHNLRLFGYRFDTEDPSAGLLNPDKVNTAPFNAFGQSSQRVPGTTGDKPTAAIYSVDAQGGDLRVEAHGIRNPAGLAFNSFANLFATNQGMELRGTRPVKDDPDVVLRVFTVESSDSALWYGWPDYSTDFRPITDRALQPPRQFLFRTGYGELSFLIDHTSSGPRDANGTPRGLQIPDRDTLLTGVFPPLSGASGIAFVPQDGPAFADYTGQLVVALRGDRAPFATSGLPLTRSPGRMVAVVDTASNTWRPLVYNAAAAKKEIDRLVLERPIDVTFGPDGSLWILDQGRMRMRDGQERYKPGDGRLYRLKPTQPDRAPSTRTVRAG